MRVMTGSRRAEPVVEIHDKHGVTPITLSETEYAFCLTILRRIFDRIDHPVDPRLARTPMPRSPAAGGRTAGN